MLEPWITADTHFGHNKLVDLLGRPEDHNQRLKEGLSNLPDHATLIHLGDVCLGNDAYWHEECIEPLPQTKVLVMGNHDRRSMSWYMDHGWDLVCYAFELKMYGRHVRFTHRPEQTAEGVLNVHGHLHNNPVFGIPNSCLLYAPEFEDYRPVKLLDFLLRNSQ